jgi:hypothetical protein
LGNAAALGWAAAWVLVVCLRVDWKSVQTIKAKEASAKILLEKDAGPAAGAGAAPAANGVLEQPLLAGA